MDSPGEVFLGYVNSPSRDAKVEDLRKRLVEQKRQALAMSQSESSGEGEGGSSQAMQSLYEGMVAAHASLATRVGLGVALALSVYDEYEQSCSISSFARNIREGFTETGIRMKRRHASALVRSIAEVEAQRLAWRHNHEFLSWLAFRRDDEKYSVKDRKARLEAFKVQERLMQCRAAMRQMLGQHLATSIESHDRFMLANRWKLDPSDENELECQVWTLLSYQDQDAVQLEYARFRHDFVKERKDDGSEAELKQIRGEIKGLLTQNLKTSLEHVPQGILSHGVC